MQPLTLTERDTFLAFDPNAPVDKPWATYAQRRGVKFKMHAKRAGALNTFSQYHDLASLYTWDDTLRGWTEFAVKDRRSHNVTCDNCSRSTATTLQRGLSSAHLYVPWRLQGAKLDEAVYGPDTYDDGQFSFLRRHGKLQNPLVMLFLCEHCRPLLA